MNYQDHKYTIEVYEEYVEIDGTLTMEEAFDWLNYFDKKGFCTLEQSESTLCISKYKTEDKILREEKLINNLLKVDIEQKDNEILLLKQSVKNKDLFVKQTLSDCSEKNKELQTEIDRLNRIVQMSRILESPSWKDYVEKTQENKNILESQIGLAETN
jgi:hypothetical protein